MIVPPSSVTEEESTVYYIVAVPYDLFRNMKAMASGNIELFFPAYDMQQELVSWILVVLSHT